MGTMYCVPPCSTNTATVIVAAPCFSCTAPEVPAEQT